MSNTTVLQKDRPWKSTRYRILKKIGTGGMSRVWLAEGIRGGGRYAIKEVKATVQTDRVVVQQSLMAEKETLMKLKHPGLAGIVDIEQEDDRICLVMEYVTGETLRDYLLRVDHITTEEILNWLRQLCDIFGYLHSRTPAIVYRDCKPANIMRRFDGRLVLIDFGTAREYHYGGKTDEVCLGTPGYASPEQYGGKGQTDARSDIYTIGRFIESLLQGCDVGDGALTARIHDSHAGSERRGRRLLQRISDRCVRLHPEDRYPDVTALLYDLEHPWLLTWPAHLEPLARILRILASPRRALTLQTMRHRVRRYGSYHPHAMMEQMSIDSLADLEIPVDGGADLWLNLEDDTVSVGPPSMQLLRNVMVVHDTVQE